MFLSTRSRTLGFRLSFLSAVVDDPPITDVTVEQGICPYLCFYLFLFFCPFRRTSKLVHSLVPIVHSPQDQNHRSMCLQEQ